jgi:electron transfer flavoprotein alpha subunit
VAALHNVGDAAQVAAKLPGVGKVHVADAPQYEHALAEPLSALLVAMPGHHNQLFAAATAIG